MEGLTLASMLHPPTAVVFVIDPSGHASDTTSPPSTTRVCVCVCVGPRRARAPSAAGSGMKLSSSPPRPEPPSLSSSQLAVRDELRARFPRRPWLSRLEVRPRPPTTPTGARGSAACPRARSGSVRLGVGVDDVSRRVREMHAAIADAVPEIEPASPPLAPDADIFEGARASPRRRTAPAPAASRRRDTARRARALARSGLRPARPRDPPVLERALQGGRRGGAASLDGPGDDPLTRAEWDITRTRRTARWCRPGVDYGSDTIMNT